MVRHGDDLLTLYQLAYALFLPGFQQELLVPDFAEALADGLPVAMRQRIIAESRDRTPLSAISVMEQRLFLGERLLREQRRCQYGRIAGARRVPLKWTRSSLRAWTVCRIRHATGHWAGRRCCGASVCVALTPALFEAAAESGVWLFAI